MWWLKFTNHSFWLTGREFSIVTACYVLGCLTVGYYLVYFRTGEDIRTCGSGNVGARNVGRALGPLGFVVTFLLDFSKGVLAVWAARYFGLGPGGTVLAVLAVVAGHIWPMQLRFRGGKGIATSFGALMVYDPVLVGLMVVTSLVALVCIRRFSVSGLIAFALAPALTFGQGAPMIKVVGISVLAILVLMAHRKNIREEIDRLLMRSEIKENESHPRLPP